MEISKEVTNLIINNLDKDILSLSFLNELKDYLIKYNDLGAALTEINFDLKSDNIVGEYQNKVISYNRNLISKNALEKINMHDVGECKITHNIICLHTIMHEIVHANQDDLLFNKRIALKDYAYAKMMFDAFCVRDGYKYNKIKQKNISNRKRRKEGTLLYKHYHDIFPDEVNADCVSAFYLLDLLKMKEYENYSIILTYILCELTRGYQLVEDKIVSPATRFYKLSKLEYDKEAFDFSNYTYKQKYELGILDNEHEIFEVFKPYMPTEVLEVDFIKIFKDAIKINMYQEKERIGGIENESIKGSNRPYIKQYR